MSTNIKEAIDQFLIFDVLYKIAKKLKAFGSKYNLTDIDAFLDKHSEY